MACIESLIANVDTEQLIEASQKSIKMSDEKIREANMITFISKT